MNVSVTVLACDRSEMTLKCLDHLLRNTFHPYTLIFVDNGSKQSHLDIVLNYISNHWKEALIIQNGENKFYAEGTNIGLRAAVDLPEKPDLVVALSNDVFVSVEWLKKMVQLMERNPKIGILSPLTDNISRTCVQADWVIRQWKILRHGEPLEAINILPSRILRCNVNIPIFCGKFRRKMLEDVGYLYEKFFILANDDDYNERVRRAGWVTAAALNCYGNHIHGATKKEIFPQPGRSEIKKRHRALLTERRAYREKTGDYRA